MNWNNLKEGKCPKCNCLIIDDRNSYLECEFCEFQIKHKKYFDLIKGKESEAYKKKIQQYKEIKKYIKNKKEKYLKAEELQEKEKQYNLAKMKRQKI